MHGRPASRTMRTTINIAAPILEELRKLQSREGGSLGDIVSRLLAETLETHRAREALTELEWNSKPMRVGVDLADKEAVYAVLDDSPSRAAPSG